MTAGRDSRGKIPSQRPQPAGAGSSSAAIRARAARIIAGVAEQGHSLDALIAAETFESAQERGLLRSLCYDSIRWYVRLDSLLERLLTRPDQKLSPELRSLAIVGLCQLLYTAIPAHAAVAETVNATRDIGEPRASGFLNAILRRFQREQAALCASVDKDRVIRTAHPRWLVAALSADWGADAPAILEANNERPAFWLRVNRTHHTASAYRQLLEAQGIRVITTGHTPESLLLERAVDVHELPGFDAGWVSIQDGAAQMAAHLVAPRAGERILDACAAPGGKTCHLLELQPELAELVAVDVSAQRLQRVEENLVRLGLRATLIAADADDSAQWWDGRVFDRILLDVPCSATGVIRRHPDIKLLRRPDDIVTLAQRQGRLLTHLWALLAPGGTLVYASCSALSAETSGVVAPFLDRHPQARDVTVSAMVQAGLSSLSVTGETAGFAIKAGSDAMDGFYYACLQKT